MTLIVPRRRIRTLRRAVGGAAPPPPPPATWATRTDVPAEINPDGTLWLVEREFTFEGAAGSPPPAPWHGGPEWAGAHPVLGGHAWRNQVNLERLAYLDGAGNLVIELNWDPVQQTAIGGYVLTDQDWVIVRPDDYRVDPVPDDGVYIEYDISLPVDQPSASWAAAWTYATVDATPLEFGPEFDYLREEVDLLEKIGNTPAYYAQRFHTNFHGRTAGLREDGALAAGHPVGEGFLPSSWWGGLAPNSGAFHKWAMMWNPGSPGSQEMFYNGYRYLVRPASGKTVHKLPHGLRLSWETEFWVDAGSPTGYGNSFGAGVRPSAQETALFPRYMRVRNVRVLRRRLPPPPGAVLWSIAALNADRSEGNSGTTAFTFTVSRTNGASAPWATVNYAVTGTGSNPATASDFSGGVMPSGVISLTAGQANNTLTVNVAGDSTVEPDENFTVTLSNPSHGSLSTISAPAVIRNDDAYVPPDGTKPTTAPVLQANGMSLIWQDRLHLPNGPVTDEDFFQETTGARTGNSDHNITLDRMSLQTFDNKRCLRVSYIKDNPIILNYRSQFFNTHYSRMGVCCDVYYPSDFSLRADNPNGQSSLYGKAAFGLLCGHVDFFQPNNNIGTLPVQYRQKGSICWPEDMAGSEIGVNFRYDRASNLMQYSFYAHVVGVYNNGQHVLRTKYLPNPPGGHDYEWAYSHPPLWGETTIGGNGTMVKGQWNRFEFWARMDTDRTNGVVEMYINGVRTLYWRNLDLGGWVGNRGLYKGRSQTAAPAGQAENWQTQPYYSFGTGPLSNDCPSGYRTLGGFRFVGTFMRHMGGGWSLAPEFIPNATHHEYLYNYRTYAA